MSQEERLSFEEAEQRVWRAIDELEEAINRVAGTPGLRDEARRAYLASKLMSLLAEKYGISPPAQQDKN